MDIDSLKRMLGTARDSALLRVTLATALREAGRDSEAETHLQEATRMDPAYTAAWKQLGKLRLALDDTAGAAKAWTAGVEAARDNGDKQAEKEMQVFLRRLERGAESEPG